jgi:hypothetical protein
VTDRDELADKEAAARLSGALETTAAGGRLTLVEPPGVPRAPHSPPTKLILALGVVLGGGSGGVALVLRELLDRSIRSANDLTRIVGDSPLVSIPAIVTPRDRLRVRLQWAGAAVAAVLVVAGGLTWVHFYVVQLDALSYQGMRIAESWLTTVLPGGHASGTMPTATP